MSDDRPPCNVFPALRYRDARAAVEWLGRAFGFAPGLVAEAPDGHVAHAELALGAGGIMLGTLREGTDNPWNAERFGVYVYVADVDAHFARARAAGAEIVRELAEMPYGAREYSARDLDGNLWSFGTYLPER
jgi:uncharacterized glyoxalase superfamily protein PhnB